MKEALSGTTRNRKERLLEILEQRGMSKNESAIFLMVVERDHPSVLADQD